MGKLISQTGSENASPAATSFVELETAAGVSEHAPLSAIRTLFKTTYDTFYATIASLSDYVTKALYDAHTILYATTDNTPAALTVGEQTLVGRATGGNISALAIDSDLSSVSASDDTIPSAKATKTALDSKAPLASPTFTGTMTVPKTLEIQDTSADHQYVLAVNELTADRTVTLPLLTGNDEFVFAAHTKTLTNKRVTKRVVTVTAGATPSINTDNGDVFSITGQNAAITSLTTNLTGTPTANQMMLIEITDDGTGRAITHGASFASTSTSTLATTTTANKKLMELFMWSTALSKWELVDVRQSV